MTRRIKKDQKEKSQFADDQVRRAAQGGIMGQQCNKQHKGGKMVRTKSFRLASMPTEAGTTAVLGSLLLKHVASQSNPVADKISEGQRFCLRSTERKQSNFSRLTGQSLSSNSTSLADQLLSSQALRRTSCLRCCRHAVASYCQDAATENIHHIIHTVGGRVIPDQ